MTSRIESSGLLGSNAVWVRQGANAVYFDTELDGVEYSSRTDLLNTLTDRLNAETSSTWASSISQSTMKTTITNDGADRFAFEWRPTVKALDFDGLTQHVNCGNDASLRITDKLSVAAWVYVDAGGGSWDNIVARYKFSGSDDRSWTMYAFGASPKLFVVRVSQDGLLSTQYKEYSTTSNLLTAGAWHHVGFTFDGGTLKLFVDGSEITGAGLNKARDDAITTIHAGTADLIIGAWDTGTFTYDGKIAGVGVYDTSVLSAASFGALYAAGQPDRNLAVSGNCVSYWLDAPHHTYPTVLDQCGSNDGTMTNMTGEEIVAGDTTWTWVNDDGEAYGTTLGDLLGYSTYVVQVQGSPYTGALAMADGLLFLSDAPQQGVELVGWDMSRQSQAVRTIDGTHDASSVAGAKMRRRSLVVNLRRNGAGAWDEVTNWFDFLAVIGDGREFTVWPDITDPDDYYRGYFAGPEQIDLVKRFERSALYWRSTLSVNAIEE